MNSTVERCTLAADLTISRILTGLWQIADMERDGSQLDVAGTASAMMPYVTAGLTTFDMADHYGSSEIIAGHFRKHQAAGKAVQLFTKWVPTPGVVTREDVRQAIERALQRMQMERIDLLQFHAWNYADANWLDCLYWLEELRAEGLIGHLGLTNFDTAHLRIVIHSGIRVVSNQVCFSLIDRRPLAGMCELCENHQIKILAYGTVAGGLLTERWLGRAEPDWENIKTWSQMKYRRFIDAAGGWDLFQNLMRAVEQVAQQHHVSMANVACRYVLDQPAVGGIIVGARLGESEHLADNLRIFDFHFDDGARSVINAALKEMRPVPGDCGDEYRKPPFLTASGDLSHHLEAMPPPFALSARNGDGQMVLSGTVWEEIGGFCRAVRRGNQVWISGTTATHGERVIGGSDPVAQTHFIIDKIEGVLQSFGGRLEDVVRTRIFVRDLVDWEVVARAHGERFAGIQPANTLVQAALVGEEYRVEMEVDALLD